MQAFLFEHYLWLKSLHIIAVVSWMAGMFYLPRLFVYHVDATPGGELSETLKVMEYRLLRIIINPAMGLTWIFGLAMVWANPALLQEGWLHVKFTCVLLLSGLHGFLSKQRKLFAKDQVTHSAKFYRVINEVPTFLLVIIVFMVVLRPF